MGSSGSWLPPAQSSTPDPPLPGGTSQCSIAADCASCYANPQCLIFKGVGSCAGIPLCGDDFDPCSPAPQAPRSR